MKLQLTTTALLLALVGTASVAQGIEGHQTGYNDRPSSEVTFSSKGDNTGIVIEQRKVQGDFSWRDEDKVDGTVTIYQSPEEDLKDGRIPR